MKRLAVVFWVVAICATAQVGEEVPTASEVWERAVAAKGGRERLYSIENVASVSRRNGRLRGSGLTVFPEKFWSYRDMRPTIFGESIEVGDESGQWYVHTTAGSSGTEAVRHPPRLLNPNGSAGLQAFQLLETRWHKPTIKGPHSERIGRKDYWVVTAQVEIHEIPYHPDEETAVVRTHEILYYIDKETYLVRRIREPEGRAYALIPAPQHLDLLDYELVDGIQMATRRVFDGPLSGRLERNVEWHFNVEYAPDLFERKPFIEDGPFGWQP